MFAWEDVKAMFNGGSRKRVTGGSNTTAVTSTSSQSPSGSEEVKPAPESPPVKVAKTPKTPCSSSSKKPKYESGLLAKIRAPEATPVAGSSTSNSPGPVPAPSPVTPPIYHHPSYQSQSLLARLNSITPVPTGSAVLAVKPPTDPAPDYSMMWSAAAGSGRFWPPYLNPLPFHPYSYYNYLINKTDQFSSLMMNPSGAGWQHLVSNKSRISPSPNKTEEIKSIEEDDGEPFVDVESTDIVN